MIRNFCLVMVLLFTSLVGVSAEVQGDKNIFDISMDVETPHTKWADPYFGPPIRVLIIAPLYAQRHSVELMQRFNAHYEIMSTYNRKALGVGGEAKSHQKINIFMQAEKEAELSRMLEKSFDVIIIGSDWNALPLEQLRLILLQVEKGTGLLIGYQQKANMINDYYRRLFRGKKINPMSILDGIPLASTMNLKAFSEKPASLFNAVSFGKGRVLELNYEKSSFTREFVTPPGYGSKRQDYENHLSLAIRSILWCAKRMPPINVITADSSGWDVKSAPKQLFVTVDSTAELENVTVEAVWRNRESEEMGQSEQSHLFAKGEGTIKVDVPNIPAGISFLDLRFILDGKIFGWACLAFDVKSEFSISEVDFSQELFNADAPIEATVSLSRKVVGKCELTASVRDVFDRIIVEERIPLTAGQEKVKLNFPSAPPLCVLHTLSLSLMVDGRCVDRVDREFSREWRIPDDSFQFVAWYGPSRNTYLNYLLMQSMAESGLDTVYLAHFFSKTDQYENALPSVRAGLSLFPYTTMTRDAELVDKHVRKPSLAAKETREEYSEWAQRSPRQLAKLCPVGYSLGDENKFLPRGPRVELDNHPEAVVFFQEWLRRKYGNIGNLNKSWDSDLSDFGDVKPIFLLEAKKAKRPAQWVDFRRCMESLYSFHHHEQARVIRELDPKAKVGTEGWFYMTSYHAFDWWDMLSELDMYVPYLEGHAGGEFVRSFKKSSFMGSFWFGSYTSGFGGNKPSTSRFFPWYSLSRGFNAAWFFNSYGRPKGGGVEFGIGGDFRPYECWQVASAECGEIKNGIDKLILNSERADDGVAVYYSASSVHAATFYGLPVKHSDLYEDINTSLRDLGINYNMVAYEQVAKGELEKGGYKLLIMPMIIAMSPKECQAVKTFIEKGGAVIADFPPGICDNSGKPYVEQPLREFFGEQAQPSKLKIYGAHGKLRGLKAKLGEVDYDFTLPVRSKIGNCEDNLLKPCGTVGESKILLRSTTKKGVSSKDNITLLNFSFNLFDNNECPLMKDILDKLIDMAGVKPAITWDLIGGKSDKPVEISVFKLDNAYYAMLMADKEGVAVEDEQDFPLILNCKDEAYIYDVRQKKYFGKCQKLNTVLHSSTAQLLAFLPYQVGKLIGNAEIVESSGIRELHVDGELLDSNKSPVSGKHVIVANVFGPDGKERKYYKTETFTKDGRFQINVPLALNDPKGRWRVKLEDVVSGASLELFVLEAEQK